MVLATGSAGNCAAREPAVSAVPLTGLKVVKKSKMTDSCLMLVSERGFKDAEDGKDVTCETHSRFREWHRRRTQRHSSKMAKVSKMLGLLKPALNVGLGPRGKGFGLGGKPLLPV
jgi:hypothetical protein